MQVHRTAVTEDGAGIGRNVEGALALESSPLERLLQKVHADGALPIFHVHASIRSNALRQGFAHCLYCFPVTGLPFDGATVRVTHSLRDFGASGTGCGEHGIDQLHAESLRFFRVSRRRAQRLSNLLALLPCGGCWFFTHVKFSVSVNVQLRAA